VGSVTAREFIAGTCKETLGLVWTGLVCSVHPLRGRRGVLQVKLPNVVFGLQIVLDLSKWAKSPFGRSRIVAPQVVALDEEWWLKSGRILTLGDGWGRKLADKVERTRCVRSPRSRELLVFDGRNTVRGSSGHVWSSCLLSSKYCCSQPDKFAS